VFVRCYHNLVIASAAKQSSFFARGAKADCSRGLELPSAKLDCFVASLLAMTGFEAVVNTAPSLRAQRSNPAFCLRAEADFLVANVGSAKLDCFVASLLAMTGPAFPAQTQRVCRRK
jgi:hypothetical protein